MGLPGHREADADGSERRGLFPALPFHQTARRWTTDWTPEIEHSSMAFQNDHGLCRIPPRARSNVGNGTIGNLGPGGTHHAPPRRIQQFHEKHVLNRKSIAGDLLEYVLFVELLD